MKHIFRYFTLGLIYINLISLSAIEAKQTLDDVYTSFSAKYELLKVHHDEENNKLYAGSVNRIYDFDLKDVTALPREIEWNPSASMQQACLSFNTDTNLCQNNVRIVQSLNSSHLYVCGTMAYHPTCAYINKKKFIIPEINKQSSQQGISHNPYASVVSTVTNEILYTATTDKQGRDGLIWRCLKGPSLRTQERDNYVLKEPEFVGIHNLYGDKPIQNKMLILFREKAEELPPYKYGLSNDPNKRNIVSRVASICLNDKGGTSWVLSGNFATFSKMSIVCDTQPDSNGVSFRYNHLESTFMLENELEDYNQTLYGLFTMPSDAIAGSAICAFDSADMKNALDTNQYWNRQDQPDLKSTYDSKQHGPSPGSCTENTQTLSQARLSFGQRHPIKFGNIFPSENKPIFQQSGVRYRKIVVDHKRQWANNLERKVTILYLITENGLLKRLVLSPRESQEPRVLRDIQVIKDEADGKVKDLLLAKNFVYVVTNRKIILIPKANCSLYLNCKECGERGGPYCEWNENGCAPALDGRLHKRSSDPSSTLPCKIAEVITQSPEDVLITEIRSNYSQLLEQHDELEAQLNTLQNQYDTSQEIYSTCRIQSETLRVSISACNDEREELSQQLKLRPTIEQFAKKSASLFISRKKAEVCQEKLSQASKQISRLGNNLNEAQKAIAETEKYYKKKTDGLLKKINGLYQEIEDIQLQAHENAKNWNKTQAMYVWKIEMCYSTTDKLRSDKKQLRKLNHDMSDTIGNLQAERQGCQKRMKRLTQLKKQYHRPNCDHNGWFLSSSTGNIFLLSKRRVNYSESIKYCQKLQAKPAVFQNSDESRYVLDLIRAFQPTRHFWIGLVKYSNSSLMWANGKPFEENLEIFPKAHLRRIRQGVQYCVEMTSSKRWGLIECSRWRRPICQRVHTGNDGIEDQNRTIVQLISTPSHDFSK